MCHMSHLFGQDTLADDYHNKRMQLLRAVPKKALIRNGYLDDFYPTPLVISSDEENQHVRIQQLLAMALTGMISNYFHDTRLQQIVPLPSRVSRELQKLQDVPYTIGFIRPDYLYDEHGTPLICEINARFGFNGGYMSAYVNTAMGKCYPQLKTLAGIEAMASMQSSLFRSKTIVVKDREEGYDIHFLLADHPNVKLIRPEQLASEVSGLKKSITVICELHQDELQECLPILCDILLSGGAVINDPRTIFIAHDKRLLAAFTDKKILGSYITATEAQELSKAFIPSFLAPRAKQQQSSALRDKSKWILKRAISGKGDGLVMGYATPQHRWETLLTSSGYVLQPFVAQKVFTFWSPYFKEFINMHVAGTLPMCNMQGYGPGLARIYAEHPHRFFRFIQPMVSK